MMNKVREIEEAKKLLDEYKDSIDKTILDYLKVDAQFTVMLKEALEVDDGCIQP